VNLEGVGALVTGGSSGLGRASAQRLAAAGAAVVIADLPTSDGVATAETIGAGAQFVPCDVTSGEQVSAAVERVEANGPLRVLIHCAGRGGPVRVLDSDGMPGALDEFSAIVSVNLLGTFNVLRLAAQAMATHEAVDGDRGVCVLTSSVAAWEGQVGQVAYASSKAGIVGMTLVAARDLASKQIRVCAIAPGIFDTPLLARVPEKARAALASAIPHPSRLGNPAEFADLAMHIVANGMLNGETIRLDGALRMGPR